MLSPTLSRISSSHRGGGGGRVTIGGGEDKFYPCNEAQKGLVLHAEGVKGITSIVLFL